MRNLYLFFGALLLVDGVFGFDVTVMEGDSVTLNPQTEIPEDASAQWWFGDTLIAQMNKAAGIFSTSEGDNVGFNGRLKLDHQTGSLTITNIRTDHTGLYTLQISGRTETYKTFSVTVRETGYMESVSVTEGDNVTLHTGVTDIQRADQIQWKSGDQVLNGADASWSNTGDLTITNIRRDQSGEYEVKIKNKNSLILHMKFRITLGKMTTVSVKEGEPIILYTGLIEIKGYDLIMWKFKDQIIAEINKGTNQFLTHDTSDERFNGRLQLSETSGSLTIRDSETTDSGVYHLNMSSSTQTVQRTISVTVKGVFGVEKVDVTVLVMEGDSVTLKPQTEIPEDDSAHWRFGDLIIAKMNKAAGIFSTSEGDERFKGRLKLDKQTGSLTITNTRTDHTGLYKLQIRGRTETSVIFSVIVRGVSDLHTPDSGLSPGAVAGIVVVGVLLVFAAVAGMIYHRRKLSELQSQIDALKNETNLVTGHQ